MIREPYCDQFLNLYEFQQYNPHLKLLAMFHDGGISYWYYVNKISDSYGHEFVVVTKVERHQKEKEFYSAVYVDGKTITYQFDQMVNVAKIKPMTIGGIIAF